MFVYIHTYPRETQRYITIVCTIYPRDFYTNYYYYHNHSDCCMWVLSQFISACEHQEEKEEEETVNLNIFIYNCVVFSFHKNHGIR